MLSHITESCCFITALKGRRAEEAGRGSTVRAPGTGHGEPAEERDVSKQTLERLGRVVRARVMP